MADRTRTPAHNKTEHEPIVVALASHVIVHPKFPRRSGATLLTAGLGVFCRADAPDEEIQA